MSSSLSESIVKEESLLLRECFYVLQGISGERIKFQDPSKNGQKVSIVSPVVAQKGYSAMIPAHLRHRSKIGSGALDAISICAEAGWLYSRVKEYTETSISSLDKKRGPNPIGSIQRALAGALVSEILSYQHFLSNLEPRIPSLSLRELLAEMKTPLFRLEQLASLTDGISGNSLPGPQILHALQRSTYHGDSRQQTLVHSLLSKACSPWFDMLFLWTTQGTLSDPAHEFFVLSTENSDDHRHLWQEEYRLDRKKVPVGILDDDLIEPAFVVGKAINFIRKCLQDGGWSLQIDQEKGELRGGQATGVIDQDLKVNLGYTYITDANVGSRAIAPIRKTLHRAAKLVHSHILRSLHEDHSLSQHLLALKQFLLLGQGDFFATLMIGIHNEFDVQEGISGVYRHTLAAIVETALRNTNATGFPADVLARLHVELLPVKGDDSSKTVWDILVLEYQVPDPLLVIVHPEAKQFYQSMFLFLFDIRRLEFLLNLTWRQSAVLQHSLQRMAQHIAVTVNTSAEYAQCTILMRKVAMIRQAMMHFVVNLKSYLMFEVLEGEWKHLVQVLERAETLDEAIQAHDKYLRGIMRKSYLQIEDFSREDSTLGSKLRECLSLAKSFCSYQEELFGEAIEKSEKANEKRKEADLRGQQGDWGIEDTELELSDEEGMYFGLADKSKMVELEEMSTEFDNHVETLLRAFDAKLNGRPIISQGSQLSPAASPAFLGPRFNDMEGEKVHEDLNSLRFLAFQLNCNRYYNA